MSGDGTAEATIGTLATGSATSRGNALGVYAQNDDVAQTVSFSLRFRPAPALDESDNGRRDYSDKEARLAIEAHLGAKPKGTP